MALTYEPIATYTTTGNVSDISFTSIPNTYTDLVISISGISNGTLNSTVLCTFNGDTSANYSGTQMYYVSTGTAGGNKNISANFISIARAAGINPNNGGRTLLNVYVFDYANTNKYKTLLCQMQNMPSAVEVDVGNWRSNAAITSINFNANWATGTVYTLYGIKAA
jgi:hypothetical protein